MCADESCARAFTKLSRLIIFHLARKAEFCNESVTCTRIVEFMIYNF